MIRSLGFDGGPTKKISNKTATGGWDTASEANVCRICLLSSFRVAVSGNKRRTSIGGILCDAFFRIWKLKFFRICWRGFGPPTAPQSTQQVRRLKSADFRFHLTRLSCSISKPHLQNCNCNVLKNFVRSMVFGIALTPTSHETNSRCFVPSVFCLFVSLEVFDLRFEICPAGIFSDVLA